MQSVYHEEFQSNEVEFIPNETHQTSSFHQSQKKYLYIINIFMWILKIHRFFLFLYNFLILSYLYHFLFVTCLGFLKVFTLKMISWSLKSLYDGIKYIKNWNKKSQIEVINKSLSRSSIKKS